MPYIGESGSFGNVGASAKYLLDALLGRMSREGVRQSELDAMVEMGAPDRTLTLANRYMAEQKKRNIKPPVFKKRHGKLDQMGTVVASSPDYDF